MSWVGPDAPPFFVRPRHQRLAWCRSSRPARSWPCSAAESKQPVVYAELPGAQHAFEVFGSVRAAYTARAVTRFLAHTHAAARATPTPEGADAAAVGTASTITDGGVVPVG